MQWGRVRHRDEPNFNLLASAKVLGEEMDIPIDNTDLVSGGGESRFVFLRSSESELTLSFNEATNGRVFFPHNWRRQTEEVKPLISLRPMRRCELTKAGGETHDGPVDESL